MDWASLLSDKRLIGDTGLRGPDQRTPARSPYQRDFDRIVFSSAFRRLQDKTQVIPFPESDFVHTRLTHSIETACVGRSLGNFVGEAILRENKELSERFVTSDFGNIVAAACLAHDVGNPPFGHAGEKAIGEFFAEKGKDFMRDFELDPNLEMETASQDLKDFEGNANGYRLLTKRGGVTGLELTCATLGAFMKYPKASLPVGSPRNVHEKKYGFFQSEKSSFRIMASELGLARTERNDECERKRHPLAFLTEAADDICYHIVDFEDGLRLNLVPRSEEALLRRLCQFNGRKEVAIKDSRERIGYLRAIAIDTLVHEVKDIFLANMNSILEGAY